MLIPLPELLRGSLQQARSPVAPKAAATIAVVRDGEHGIEAFLMRRQASMAFAAGMYVFPGGGVHAEDAEPLPWAGPGADYFADRFSCSVQTAHALVVSAVRETFEETGVLLAGADEHSIVGDATEFQDARRALEQHELSFGRFLDRNGLVLRADLLGAWAHWITPAFEPRRYDTRFFVTALPEGQHVGAISSEADKTVWAPISRVLELVDAGRAAMLPPTAVTCRELSAESTATVLEAARIRSIRPIEPRLVELDGELWLDTESEDHL